MLRIPLRLAAALAAAALSWLVAYPAAGDGTGAPEAPRAQASAPAPAGPPPGPGTVEWVERFWVEHAEQLSRRLLDRVPARWRPYLDPVLDFATDPVGLRVGVGLIVGLGILFGLLRLARRPGDLVVCLDYPAELRGTFSVQIGSRKSAIRRRPPAERTRPQDAASTRTEHHLVARETHFRGFAPGRYWVGVEGVLEDPGTCMPVDECFELRAATVLPRRTTRLALDVKPRCCAVLVKLLWSRKGVSDGAVSLLGVPDSLRYTKQGMARLEVPLGTHRILAGSGDRVAEAALELQTLRSVSLEIDLGASEGLVFKGCPPAVAPYLRGDLGAALHALRSDGQQQLAQRLEAEIHEHGGQLERAALLYDQAGDSQNAVRLLLEVKPEHSGYVTACERLADSFEREGELEMAAARIEAAIDRADRGRVAALYLRWSVLLERLDQLDGARGALAKLGEIEPDHPELAARSEQLEKQRAGERTRVQPPSDGEGYDADTDGSRYQLLERIGTGGMGVVFRALDRRLRREIALKRLPEAMADTPTAVTLFLREARAAASLNHPNIVTLFDADEEDGQYFITMELLAGATLGALKRRRGRFAAADIARVGRQVCEGLQYAHRQRVVHRDVKPANLFLTHDGSLKIMDFGLAKSMEEVRRATTVIGGTPYYMSPEQTRGDTAGPPADLYSLGVTFFELATGRLPFTGGDIAGDHQNTPPPDPRDLAADLPDPLAELIVQLLAKQPAARPASAADVASRLAAIASEADASSVAQRIAASPAD